MFDLMPFAFGRNSWMNRMRDPFEMMNKMFENFGAFDQLDMRCDVEDLGDRYELNMELPGMDKDEISLKVANDVLTIRAEHKTETEHEPDITAEQAEADEEKKDSRELKTREHAELQRPERNFVHRERSYRSMERSFNVEDIVVSEIKASYMNGILTVVLPKKHATPAEDDVYTVEID